MINATPAIIASVALVYMLRFIAALEFSHLNGYYGTLVAFIA